MNLLIISHKESWQTADGLVTIGGFPLQMAALSHAFSATTILLPMLSSPVPYGKIQFTGKNTVVQTLGVLDDRNNWRRKLAVVSWWRKIWLAVRQTDSVHIPLPGDVGTVGLVITWLQRKPLLVRYCGPWGRSSTVTEKFLHWFLDRVAYGSRTIVFATGGGAVPPEPGNPHIRWIHSTTLSHAEWQQLPQAQPWRSGETLKLVTVGRLSPVKNQAAIIQALPRILQTCPAAELHIVGGGPLCEMLTKLADELGVSDNIVFHGSVGHEAVLRILSESHLFVFPSVFEGFPKALLEAMACGLPAVATNVSVIPHLISDRCGALLDTIDSPTIANAILSLVSDDSRLEQMAHNARSESSAYTLEKWVQRYADVIHDEWGMQLSVESNVYK